MSDLYLLGDRACLELPRMAVVGTRRVSKYGQEMTEWFVKELVQAGYCIVSGLARGVDGIAAKVAMENGGKTIAVVAHGVDKCYPPEHRELRDEIIERGGLVVSEYPEGVEPTRDKFRARNRLIVKLSEVVLVLAAPKRSGTKISVGWAAEEGKTVYVVPGPITQASFHGSVEIIRDGGVPVYSPEDLLTQMELGI